MKNNMRIQLVPNLKLEQKQKKETQTATIPEINIEKKEL